MPISLSPSRFGALLRRPLRSALNRTPRVGLSLLAVAAALVAAPAHADDGSLWDIATAAPAGVWTQLNLNAFSDAYANLEIPGTWGSTDKVISAWSSVVWDADRGDLLLFGGGHGNYGGNEMYRWNGTSRLWELASLPSQMVEVDTHTGSLLVAADGVMNAPTSIHTYDNASYLSVAGRYLVLGGAAYNVNIEQQQVLADGTLVATGPYVFDPAKADGTLVGGTTGSGVDASTAGGQMWQNRNTRADLFNVTTWRGTTALSMLDGTSASTVENGVDVVYFTGRAGPENYLMRYQVTDIDDPSQDVMTVIGVSNDSSTPYGAAAYDSDKGFYVSLSTDNSQPFVVWDVAQDPGAENEAISISVDPALGFDGASIGGIDWNAVDGAFYIWTGAGDVWRLESPSSGVMSDDWQLSLVNDGDTMLGSALPDGMSDAGVRGKWVYVSALNAFLAVEGNTSGDVWLYRPTLDFGAVVGSVPELGSGAMAAAGLAAVAVLARRRRGV